MIEERQDPRYEDVSRCLLAREVLLKSLHSTTLAFLRINNANFHDDGLASFLEANNISQGRYFDSSTLPSSEHLNAPPADFSQSAQNDQKSTEAASPDHSEYAGGDKDAGTGLEAPKASTSADSLSQGQTLSKGLSEGTPAGTTLDKEPLSTAQQENGSPVTLHVPDDGMSLRDNDITRGESDLRPPEAPLLPSDEAGSVDGSTVKELASEQKSTNAHSEVLPSKRSSKDSPGHLDSDKSHTEEVENIARNQVCTIESTDAQIIDHLTPPASGEGATSLQGTQRSQASDVYPMHDGILKSQMDVARSEALVGAPATPDEQLRFEEAQSMLPSKAHLSAYGLTENVHREIPSLQPPSNLSSQFINDNLTDGDAMADISNISNEMSTKESIASEEPFADTRESALRPALAMRNNMFSGINGESSKDLTLSRRPPMRINTGVPSFPEPSNQVAENKPPATAPTTVSAFHGAETPNKSAPPTASAHSPPERMTTRVSSGALRHKSVSEILGETPKPITTPTDKGPQDRVLGYSQKDEASSLQTPKSASSRASSDSAAFKQRLSELRDKERSKLSTVIFASSRNTEATPTHHSDANGSPIQDRDYLFTLFAAQVSSPPRSQSLKSLIQSAHKTLTTSDHYTDFNERQACRVLNKVYEMQAGHHWPLRQHERSVEPKRPVTHLDVLLKEMTWMRTDFREEKKWRLAAAKWIADACAEWVASSPEERKLLQVRVRHMHARQKSRSLSVSTPDLVHSADDEASEITDDEFPRGNVAPGSAPAAIFSLPPEMFVFGLNKSPVAEKLLLELPLYQPSAEVQDAALGVTEILPDASWKTPIVPVSKYAQGKMVTLEEGPPRKRSRYDYQDEDRFRSGSAFASETVEEVVNPEQDDVALFDPENRHIRDRIHAGHAFRPPSEHIMPSQSFFESRQPSQWTQGDDAELRRLVREFSYNWSLISSCLSSPSLFSSGAERRTPWECFERWINLEGLPQEMAKINYFRAYTSRLLAASKTYEAKQQAIQQQHGTNANPLPLRRRNTQPYNVERRKNAKHFHLIDAMRKLAKKRETAVQKQNHVASMAAMRKANEAVKPRTTMHTPREFSRLKYERQLKVEETAKAYRMQVMAQQKAAQAAKANLQSGQQSNGIQPVRNVGPGVPNGSSPNMTSALPNGQQRVTGETSRQLPQMQRLLNGQTNGNLTHSAQGIPHAPMQPQMPMQMQQRMPPNMIPDGPTIQAASRVQAEQTAFIQQQRAQRHPQVNGQASSPNMQNHSLLSQNNPAGLASFQGRSSPLINGVPPANGSSTSPRMAQPQALSSGVTPAVNQISSQFKQRHPQASPEQITRMTTDQLYKVTSEARQSAMQAAAGNVNANAVASNNNLNLQPPAAIHQQAAMMANGASPMLNPQQYAQVMRMQQATQQRGSGGSNGQAVNGSRSATPLVQKTGSGQGGPRPSQSPSSRQVGLAGGQ